MGFNTLSLTTVKNSNFCGLSRLTSLSGNQSVMPEFSIEPSVSVRHCNPSRLVKGKATMSQNFGVFARCQLRDGTWTSTAMSTFNSGSSHISFPRTLWCVPAATKPSLTLFPLISFSTI